MDGGTLSFIGAGFFAGVSAALALTEGAFATGLADDLAAGFMAGLSAGFVAFLTAGLGALAFTFDFRGVAMLLFFARSVIAGASL